MSESPHYTKEQQAEELRRVQAENEQLKLSMQKLIDLLRAAIDAMEQFL